MQIDNNSVTNSLLATDGIYLVFRGLILVLAILYFIFTLFVIRQVHLMTETLITAVAPGLKIFSIIYASLALGVVILFVLKLFA